GVIPFLEISSMSMPTLTPSTDALHQGFLTVLPAIESHARAYFRTVRCPGQREDAIAETLAIAWLWYLRMTRRGKDIPEAVAELATHATRHVRKGRKLRGRANARSTSSMRPTSCSRRFWACCGAWRGCTSAVPVAANASTCWGP